MKSRIKLLTEKALTMKNVAGTTKVRLEPEDFLLLKNHFIPPWRREAIKDSFSWNGIEFISL